METISELLFPKREKVKELIKKKKKGIPLAKRLGIPLEELTKYKSQVKEDLEHCTKKIESFGNFEEYKYFSIVESDRKMQYREPEEAKDKIKSIAELAKEMAQKPMNPSDQKQLNTREELYVMYYIKHSFNGTKAASLAGYEGAELASVRLLKRPHVSYAIATQIAKKIDFDVSSPEQIMEQLSVLKARAMQAHPVLDSDGYFLGEWKYNEVIALKILELEGKYWKMFSDRVEHVGLNGGPIQHEVETKWNTAALSVDEHRELIRLWQKMHPVTIDITPEP